MARQALAVALCLSLAVMASTDCVTQCSLCAAQTRTAETSVWPLVSAAGGSRQWEHHGCPVHGWQSGRGHPTVLQMSKLWLLC